MSSDWAGGAVHIPTFRNLFVLEYNKLKRPELVIDERAEREKIWKGHAKALEARGMKVLRCQADWDKYKSGEI